jgi:hypothetical protein
MLWSLLGLFVAMALSRQAPAQVAATGTVGAASVTADPTECARATSVQLWWTGTTRPLPLFVASDKPSLSLHPVVAFNESQVLVTDQAPAPCRWTFSALPPGPYVVGLEGPQGSGGAQAFEVVAGRTAEVAILPPTVTVSGRILFNGQPMPRARVQFARSPGRDGVASFSVARSDDSGRYSLVLDRPGEFRYEAFRVGAIALPQELGPVTLEAGANVLDVLATGTEIRVTVHGWDGSTPTTIAFAPTGSDQTRLAAFLAGRNPPSLDLTLRAGDSPKTSELNLKDGTYRVLAYQSAGRLVSSAAAVVTIDPTHPMAEVALDLVRNDGTLTIRDGTGQLVSGVIVSPSSGLAALPRLPETAPGVYALAGVPSGADLWIRPPAGFAPSCRVATIEARQEAAVTRGRSTDAVFERHGLAGPVPLGLVSGVNGANCPVPLTLFTYERTPGDPGDLPHGHFADFPQSRTLTFDYQGVAQTVLIPERGPVVIR